MYGEGMLLPLNKNKSDVTKDDVTKSLEYIANYWEDLTQLQVSDRDTLIGLPYPYIVPTANTDVAFRFNEQYYWDSYFIVQGLLDTKHQVLVEGMLENLLHLLKRFGMIPTASRMYFTSRTQPPLLTSFIFAIYDAYNKDDQWLKDKIEAAKTEYTNVWMSNHHPHWHVVHDGLSRYYDVNMLHDLAEAASGWDMTPRFERKCLDYIPIDLNCLLYKYEIDFARASELFGNNKEAQLWNSLAEKRKASINKCMWANIRGFYFDYNYQKNEKSNTWSLAAYFALWAGIASDKQAKRLVENLSKFEVKGGLTTTTRPLIDMSIFGSLKTQWAYPNGWAPLHYIVCEGLEAYGYHAEAERIAKKWLSTNLEWFKRTGNFQEKYNVVNPRRAALEGVYPTQTGFGWTNAVFHYMCNKYLIN